MPIRVVFNNFDQISAELHSKAGRIVAESARAIAEGARGLAPMRTGELRESIAASQAGAFHWHVEVGARYGEYVNFGTNDTPARAFWTQAIEQETGVFVARWVNLIAGGA